MANKKINLALFLFELIMLLLHKQKSIIPAYLPFIFMRLKCCNSGMKRVYYYQSKQSDVHGSVYKARLLGCNINNPFIHKVCIEQEKYDQCLVNTLRLQTFKSVEHMRCSCTLQY